MVPFESKVSDYQALKCRQCVHGEALGFDFSMAFQPLVDLKAKEIFGYEALARGPEGQGVKWVMERVNPGNLYRFDQTCRVKAIQLAKALDLQGELSINFMPNAIYHPELCIRTTLAACREFDFPTDRINFEVNEMEQVTRPEKLLQIIETYRSFWFSTSFDDFGAGYAGLNLLADIRPNLIKIDIHLIRGIDQDRNRQIIVSRITQMAQDLQVRVLGEGVETAAESRTLQDMGIHLQQGFYFAKPGFRCLPEVDFDPLQTSTQGDEGSSLSDQS